MKQIAKSFVEGKAIEIDGGNYKLEKDWYRCESAIKLIEVSKIISDAKIAQRLVKMN
ncbi:MAG: hypothetical protein MZU84_00175 [Sphingobacterium sp.]|nr:hypothetical protein [Sphingobacterium sp.]